MPDDQPYDAAWTNCGNIVYTTQNGNKVIVVSPSSDVIAEETQMINPRCFSVFAEDVICVADWESGVYQSTDEGVK